MGYIQHRVPCCRTKWEEKLKNKIRRNTSILMDYEMDGDMIILNFTYPNYNGGPWDFIVNGVDVYQGIDDMYFYFTDGRTLQFLVPEWYKTGINTIQIVYHGDPEHPAEEAYFKLNLERQDGEIFVDEDISAKAGNNITISVSGPDDIYGDVTLTVDNVEYTGTFEDGSAVINIDGLNRGTYIGYISYLGDTLYNPYSTSININVTGIDAVLSVSLDNITVGETALISIRGLEDMSENVTLIINGTEYTGIFISGQATISIEGLEAGTHTFNVYYPGDTKYNPCTTSDEITVYPLS